MSSLFVTPLEKEIANKMITLLTNFNKLRYDTADKPEFIQTALMVNISNALSDLYTLMKQTDNADLQKYVHELWYATDSHIVSSRA